MKLKEALKIRAITLKNRLVMPPMATSSAVDGKVGEALLRYYDEKSRGGHIGLIITEHSYIMQSGKADKGQISVAQDQMIPGLCALAETIHANGAHVFAQINHAGSAADRVVTGMDAISASAVMHPRKSGGIKPAAMTQSDIDEVVAAFSEAAYRVKAAGFDGVEIHSAHGYLLNQFYSPLTNRREDAYGVDCIEHRLRLHIEVLDAVRRAVGANYPIAVRLGGCDYRNGGATIEDSVAAARLLEQNGADLLDISGGMNGYIVPNRNMPGYFSDMTERIREAVTIPVILTGGIMDGESAEMLLQTGKADLIGMGRAILRDSGLAERIMTQAHQSNPAHSIE